jgi:protein involved in polysaccharide export with SLBB domain
MEGAIDPATYIVGPNDLFTVSVGGASPVQSLVPVSADGNIVLPEAGTIPAADRTLREVIAQAEAMLEEEFENVPVTVALSQPRTFYVHVTGAVPSPGRYQAQPVARVESVVKQALMSSGENPDTERRLSNNYRPSLRHVVIEHKDGSREAIDLLLYYATGNKDHNPYLQDGDVIHITSFNPDHNAVQITGEVAYPGVYEYRPGDTVMDLLRLATGPTNIEQLDTVRVTRQSRTGPPVSSISNLSDILANRSEAMALRPGDVVRVPSFDADAGRATVSGFVEYPGNYTIREGETTLHELVEMAGGFRPAAHVPGAVLQRSESRRPSSRARTNSLGFVGRTFLQQSLEGSQELSINVARALESTRDTIRIYSGDQLIVPRDERSVLVVGEVNQPGYVPYARRMGLSDYIGEAGGTGDLATQTYVIKAESSQWKHADQVASIESGDVIFVNREPVANTPEIQQLSLMEQNAERDARIRTIQTILTGIGTVTSIITTFIALNR